MLVGGLVFEHVCVCVCVCMCVYVCVRCSIDSIAVILNCYDPQGIYY